MKNKGMMQIVSDDGFYQFGHEGETTTLLSGRFPGTVVNLEFKTDDSCSYSLKSEIDKKYFLKKKFMNNVMISIVGIVGSPLCGSRRWTTSL